MDSLTVKTFTESFGIKYYYSITLSAPIWFIIKYLSYDKIIFKGKK
jgi:hypothetical protein